MYRLLAICSSNLAAAYLLEGDGMYAEKALESAERAEEMDPTYEKGYYRQARAHEVMGNVDKAISAMERALACPEIVDKSAIDVRIAELQAAKEMSTGK
ncbi:hypothetical protein BV25DRAFT_1914485 [Artomyces pyxidatus]|uniref:Uncharacterized protein n=1 Tax=Artomyces pyxidatus TaxID=48021 RepID=A0ACB8T7L9_9AGAM|nr:hypothetical protein BV25DRAFT_1914485 [Artomyces pyxidatus]